jgi:hypothetical protein
MMASNFARMAFLSWRRRVPFASCTCSSCGVQVGIGAGHLGLVVIGHRQAALQRRQHRRVLREALAPLHVLHEHVGLERGLVAEQFVLVGLDRADDEVEAVVLHVEPGHVARTVLVGAQRLGAQFEVLAQAWILGEPRCTLEQDRGALELGAVVPRVRHDLQHALGVAGEHGVLAAAARQVRAVEFLARHVERIEAGDIGLRTDTRHERRIAGEAVPRPVVDLDEAARGRVGDAREQLRSVAGVRLPPEQVVHDHGRIDEQAHHLPFLRAERREVGGERDRRVDLGPHGRQRCCVRGCGRQ